MRSKTVRRKAKTNYALVHNPRGLSLGSSSRRTVRKKANPTARTKTAAVANPRRKRRRTTTHHRRRHNPGTTGGLLVAGFMTALGVSLLDFATSKFLPPTSQLVSAAIKIGLGFGIQAYGQKVPILGKYKGEIALVSVVWGATDLIKLYLLPVVNNFTGGALQLVQAPAAAATASDGSLAGLYPAAVRRNYY